MLLTTTALCRSRPRTADTTRREIVGRYHRSDLTQRAFCEQAGIPLSTLQWWLVKARREAAPAPPVTFREVMLPDDVRPNRGVDLAWAVEIVTRAGVTLRLREPVAPADLVVLLHGARC
jgi:transposase-like protein